MADAVALGLRSNRTVRSLYVQRIAQRYDLWVAQQRFVPSANINGSVGSTRNFNVNDRVTSLGANGTWLVPTGAIINYSWDTSTGTQSGVGGFSQARTFSVTQPLLRGAGIAINTIPVRVAQLHEDINRLNVRNTINGIITGIVIAYRNLIQARDQVELARNSLTRSREQLDVNRVLVTAGRMASADLVQNEADIANQELALLQAQRSVDAARLALLRLLALDLHTRLGKLDSLSTVPVKLDLDRLVTIARTHRVELLTQEKAVEQARLGLTLARDNRLWDVSAVGTVTDNRIPGTNRSANGSGTSSSIGLRLTIPLNNSLLKQAEVVANTTVQTGELMLQEISQQVESDIRDSVAQVESNWLQLQVAVRAHDLAKQALALSRTKLKAGRASNF